jgi:hypothetical protein
MKLIIPVPFKSKYLQVTIWQACRICMFEETILTTIIKTQYSWHQTLKTAVGYKRVQSHKTDKICRNVVTLYGYNLDVLTLAFIPLFMPVK